MRGRYLREANFYVGIMEGTNAVIGETTPPEPSHANSFRLFPPPCPLTANFRTCSVCRMPRYDEAELRFTNKSCLEKHCYVRQDGTLARYFDLEALTALCESTGLLQCEESYYVTRQYANRGQKKARYRVWIHLKCRRLREKGQDSVA